MDFIAFDTGVTTLPKLWPWVKIGETPDGLDIIEVRDVGRYVFGKGGLRDFDAWVQYGTGPMPVDVRKFGSRYFTNAEYCQLVLEVYERLVPNGGAQLMAAEDGAPYVTSPSRSDAYRAAGWVWGDGGWTRDGVAWQDAYFRALEESAPPPNALPPSRIEELERRVAALESLLRRPDGEAAG